MNLLVPSSKDQDDLQEKPLTSDPASAVAVRELATALPGAYAGRLGEKTHDLVAAYSANTLKTWRADWRVWNAFCRVEGLMPLPASLPALDLFLRHCMARGRARATIEHYLSTLATVHRMLDLPWPLNTYDGRLKWRGFAKALTRSQRQAKGLTLDDRDAICGSIESSSSQHRFDQARDARDAALICVAYEALLRRSELVALRVDDLVRAADGSGLLTITRSKTDQEGDGAQQYLSPETVERIARWRDIAGIREGFLFRSVPNQPREDAFARPLTGRDVARILKRRAARAGVNAEGISGHSARVGAAQDLIAANFSTAAIMKQGRWQSERMVIRYGREIEAKRGAMAQLLKSRKT